MKRIYAFAATLAVTIGFSTSLARAASQQEAHLAPILIQSQRQQLIGLTFAKVSEAALVDTIHATGTVDADEQLESYVQTRFSGWIRRVYAAQTYQYVKQGEPLFTIYSPDLVSAENEYLLALRESRTLQKSEIDNVASGAKSMAAAALDRLRLFGVPAREIRRLEREGTARDEVEVDSPASGYIIDRQAFPNMYAEPSTRLFTIANLSRVWVYVAIFQDQLGEIRKGDRAQIRVDTFPGREFGGAVDFIWSALDPATRTAKVRCNLPNPDGALKLGMFVNVTLTPHVGRGLVIPDSGVLQTGRSNIAFVDRGDGYLDPREVELGPHLGHEFVVRKGLSAGERIVSSANFLVDSESQLQAAVGAYVPPPPGASAAGQAAAQTATIEMTTTPTPPRKGSNQIVIHLRDSFGKPISGANVSVVFFMPAMPAMGMAAMRRVAAATERPDGSYEASIALDSGGQWQVSVSASKGGQQVASWQSTVSATGGM